MNGVDKYQRMIEGIGKIYQNIKYNSDVTIPELLKQMEELFPEVKDGENEKYEECERIIASLFEKVGLANFARELHNEELHYILQSLMMEIAKVFSKTKPKKNEDEKIRKEILELVSISGNGNQFEEIKDWLEKQGAQKPNPYSGISFEYNGHTWGMCAREGGVEISIDGRIIDSIYKEGLNSKDFFIRALERVEELNEKGYKLTNTDKSYWWEDFKSCCVDPRSYNECCFRDNCKTIPKEENVELKGSDYAVNPEEKDMQAIDEQGWRRDCPRADCVVLIKDENKEQFYIKYWHMENLNAIQLKLMAYPNIKWRLIKNL